MIDLTNAKLIAAQFVGQGTPALGCFASGDHLDAARIIDELDDIDRTTQMHEDDRKDLHALRSYVVWAMTPPPGLPLGHSDLHAQLQQTVGDLMELQVRIDGICLPCHECMAIIKPKLASIINGLVDLVGAPEDDDE